jgi:FAD/FMN-containing dehydrogenase
VGDVDHATHAFGLAIPFGIVSTTGVAGLTLSGGNGYLSRQYGLAIDNLVEAEVVLADGTFVIANKTDSPISSGDCAAVVEILASSPVSLSRRTPRARSMAARSSGS